MSLEYLKEISRIDTVASNIARRKALEGMKDAKEFSAAVGNNGLEGSVDAGGPCIGAPCNPGPGGPPPKCPPRPPRES